MEEALSGGLGSLAGYIALGVILIIVLRMLLPAQSAYIKAQEALFIKQEEASKVIQEAYDKKLAASELVMEQRIKLLGIAHEHAVMKLQHEIDKMVTATELDRANIALLEKRAAVFEEDNTKKGKRVDEGLSQIADLLTQVKLLTEERDNLVKRVSSLELQIATLLAPANIVIGTAVPPLPPVQPA